MADQEKVTVMAVGDVFVSRPDPQSIFEHVKPVFQAADIRFGNCEGVYSEVGEQNPTPKAIHSTHPSNVLGLRYAGFDAMAFANNCHMDLGYEGFLRTLEVLHEAGIATAGAGRNIVEARQPAVITKNDTKVAFLAYCSVVFPGYDAGTTRPGCAPLKVYTHYHQEEYEQPGSEAAVLTFPDPSDLEALREDISKARPLADVVVVSFHWGLHLTPAKLTAYERQVARLCIDEGADLIVGHHQHVLKPIEIYKGRPIFYGLANFACDFGDAVNKPHQPHPLLKKAIERYKGFIGFWPDYPNFPFGPEARQTIIAKCVFAGGKIEKISYVPCMINPENAPVPLAIDDERFAQIKTYIETIGASQGIETEFATEDSEVVVLAPAEL